MLLYVVVKLFNTQNLKAEIYSGKRRERSQQVWSVM